MNDTEPTNNAEAEPDTAQRKPGPKKKPKSTTTKASKAVKKADSAATGKLAKRSFPGVSLEDALKVAQAIRQKNNGHPWASELVATACGTTPKAMKFFYLAAAARDYGLTIGSRDTPQISLTELGRNLLYASSADIEQEKKIEAFFKVEKFKQVYDFYEGSNLPEQQYLANALENQFQIDPADHKEFTSSF